MTLKLDHPDFPDDMEFGISELGRVKNHGTLEVDDDAVATFEATRGMSIAEALYGNGIVTVEGAPTYTPEETPEEALEVIETLPEAGEE